MAPIKANSKRLWIMVSILLIAVIILLISFNQCGKNSLVDSEEMAGQQDFRREIQDIDTLDPGSYAQDRLPDTECSQGAELYIANGPGRPQEGVAEARLIHSIIQHHQSNVHQAHISDQTHTTHTAYSHRSSIFHNTGS